MCCLQRSTGQVSSCTAPPQKLVTSSKPSEKHNNKHRSFIKRAAVLCYTTEKKYSVTVSGDWVMPVSSHHLRVCKKVDRM